MPFGLAKQKEELKKDIREEIDGLVEDGRIVSLGILAVSCLTIGYMLGSITTGAMYRVLVELK